MISSVMALRTWASLAPSAHFTKVCAMAMMLSPSSLIVSPFQHLAGWVSHALAEFPHKIGVVVAVRDDDLADDAVARTDTLAQTLGGHDRRFRADEATDVFVATVREKLADTKFVFVISHCTHVQSSSVGPPGMRCGQ